MNRSSISVAVAALVLCAVAVPASGQFEAAPPLEILYGFTLIDGLGGPPIEDAALAIRGNEILTVSSRRELLSGPNAPRNAVPVNLGGGWVIPGLIDAHVHLATNPNRTSAEAELYRQLYGGVTAVRDMAGDARALASLARDSRLGEIDAPDVYYSALMAGPSFLTDPRPQSSAAGETAGNVPWMQAVTPDTDIRDAVAQAKGTFASGIKIYANLSAADVTRITEEGHRQGMQVWAHSMVFPARPLEVVRAGVDVVSHVCRLAWEAMADAPTEYHHDRSPQFGTFSADSPVFTELFGEMRSHGTVLDATLALYARADSLSRDDPEGPAAERCDTEFARQLVARAHAEGVPIAAGTDFTSAPDAPYPALHRELEELVRAGLPPMAAIEAATRVAAEAIGVQDRLGTLRHGRPVTFVLLAENPLEDIANLRSVRAVWKNAERYDRAAYRPVIADARPRPATETQGATSARQALELWLALWRRYDLDRLDRVFLRDASLTYFASDTEGLLEGYEAVLQHHRELGFLPGGYQPERELWVEDVLVTDFDESAVITGTWYFGNRVGPQTAARGRLTMVLVRTSNGYKISHLHLGDDRTGG
jgi:imidazolonepropionase-like amidohydrolase